ncbi:RRM_1 domain-containing protein [Cephalotus follicularis]|uniref:RRM_1 domain-containing protein n=1 Tax=Cephalotus follicularis TaxID=3775 RepID=A0A1Q3BU66_CEPFO|nr:RRM_1 domain-containing protein [Cephalotus follicularis]
MPPRTTKRGGAAKRSTRGTPKPQYQAPEVAEEPVKVEEEVVILDEKPIFVQDKSPNPIDANNVSDADVNGIVNEEDVEVKESVEEYEKDERLELDDNEPEYEPEEYDEKEIEQEDVQYVGDDVEEEEVEEEEDEEEEAEEEEDDVEEGDLVEEEVEEVHEELEGEEADEHATVEPGHAEHEVLDDVEEEHHELFKERRKRKEFEVFVGGLDKDATEEDLRKAFNQVGEIIEIRLMMNPQTKKNKGFAFLRFATVEQAKRAVIELRNPVIHGKQCGVTPSQDSDTLFLGNICKTWTKEDLKEKLKHYGVNNVEDLTLVEDSNNEGLNRGFAFLEFSSRSEAMDAFKRLQKRDVLFGVDRPAKVSFADSFIDPGDEIMSQVKTVFVDGLPASWDEDRVRELIKKYGVIEKVELARNMPSAKRKDFGFVTFDSHDSAVTCAKSINNVELGEGDNKAKVRARLSRPLQRGKGKHVSRGDFRSGRGIGRVTRGPWGRPAPRSLPGRGVRGLGSRGPPPNVKRPVGLRDRRPVMSVPARGRPLVPPARSYDRRAPVPSYPRSSLKREYGRRDAVPPPRSRAAVDYGSRAVPERRPYRDEYSSRGGSGYSDLPRNSSRTSTRRAYVDDGYGQRFERPPPSYREGRARDYDSISGSKRPYSAVDEVPPRYADSSVRHSRARLDYELGGGASQYGETYGDRLGRSNMGYGSSRSTMSGQDSHGLYSNRQGMGYGGEVLLVVGKLVDYTLQAMEAITCLVEMMLVVDHTHRCTPLVAWVAAVTWVLVALDYTTDI